jgi:hypothetical protein
MKMSIKKMKKMKTTTRRKMMKRKNTVKMKTGRKKTFSSIQARKRQKSRV